MERSDSLSSVSPTFVGDLSAFQLPSSETGVKQQQQQQQQQQQKSVPCAFRVTQPVKYLSETRSYSLDDEQVNSNHTLAIPNLTVINDKINLKPKSFSHQVYHHHHHHHQDMIMMDENVTNEYTVTKPALLATETPPQPTKLTRSTAIMILPHDTKEQVNHMKSRSVGNGFLTNNASNIDHSYVLYMAPSAPRKIRPTGAFPDMDEGTCSFAASLGGLENANDDGGLGFSNLTLDCSFESPLLESRVRTVSTNTTPRTALSEFHKSPFTSSRSTTTPPSGTTLKAPPSYSLKLTKTPSSSSLRRRSSFCGGVGDTAPIKPPHHQATTTKRVSWIYPHGIPDESTTTLISQDPMILENSASPMVATTSMSGGETLDGSSNHSNCSMTKRPTRLFPGSGIDSDDVQKIVRPTALRLVAPTTKKRAFFPPTKVGNTRSKVSHSYSQFGTAATANIMNDHPKRYSYPGSMFESDMKKLSMGRLRPVPKRVEKPLYPSVDDTLRALDSTAPLFGRTPKKPLVEPLEIMHENTAFQQVLNQRRSDGNGVNRPSSFGSYGGAFSNMD